MSQSYHKSFLKDNAIVIAGHILVYAKGIILMPIVIKTVGVTVYGGFVLLSSVLGIVSGISSFGAGYRASRFMPSSKTILARRDLFYPQLIFNLLSILCFSAVLLLLDKQINTYIFKNELTYSPLIIPLYLIMYFLYSQGTNYFRYTSRIHYMTAATLAFPYLHISFILVYFYFFQVIDINVLILSLTLAAFLISFPCFVIIFKEIGGRFSFYSIKGLVEDIKLGFPLVLGFIVDFILAGSDRYFIAYFMGVSAVGYYNPGYVLGSLIVFIPKAMGTALPQLLSKAVDSGDEEDAQRMLHYALKFFLLLAIPFIFGSKALGKPILTLLADSDVAAHAYWVTPVVAVGTLFYGLNIILSNVLFVRMKTYSIFKINLFAALFNVLANAIVFYIFRDILVAAFTTFASYFLAFLYLNRFVKKMAWPIDLELLCVIKICCCSFIMFQSVEFLFSYLCINQLWLYIVLCVIISIIIYVLLLFTFRVFTHKELKYIRGLFA